MTRFVSDGTGEGGMLTLLSVWFVLAAGVRHVSEDHLQNRQFEGQRIAAHQITAGPEEEKNSLSLLFAMIGAGLAIPALCIRAQTKMDQELLALPGQG